MWWSRHLPCALVVLLAAGVAFGARNEPRVGQDESAEEQAAEASAAPQSSDASPPEEVSSADSEPPGETDADSSSDSEAELPGLLIFKTDAPSYVSLDGELKGLVEPDLPLEVRVDLGEIEIRAAWTLAVGPVWEKTIELNEPGEKTVRIKMEKAIRLFRLEERKTGVFRDPKSSLMWLKKDNGQDVDLRRAYAHCRDLETGGYDDWRLPLLEELKSLESIWHRGTYKIRGEILLTECCLWSSEYDGSERAWTFNYRFRQAFQANAGYAIGLRALCVREWSPETETGQKGAEAEGGEPGAELGDG